MGYSEINLQRKIEIEECLLEMMKDTLFEEITVKALSEKLQIARKTFYHYYPNKWECLISLTERLLYECNLREMQAASDADAQGLCRIRLSFWIAHRDYLEVINRNKLELFLVKQIMEFLFMENRDISLRLNTGDDGCDEDIVYFCICGQVCLLLKWAQENFRQPLEEMVKKCIHLAREPLARANM